VAVVEKLFGSGRRAGEAQLRMAEQHVQELIARLTDLERHNDELRQQLEWNRRLLEAQDRVLQQLPVEVGQRVIPGANLARVADPKKLKAQIKIAETQAKDIQINQKASIDTRNGVVEGHVIRVDPAVEQGTVTVDVAIDGQLPKGARPDLSVDGTIELERLDNVVYVGRPAFGQDNSTVGLFKIVSGSSEAVRTPVKLGRSSVNTIEIQNGLQPGDQVILSDTSAWDSHERIRLN